MSVEPTPTKPLRGRRPGPIPRGNCPVCGRDSSLRLDGSPFTHRTIAANGYTRLGFCPGGEGAR